MVIAANYRLAKQTVFLFVQSFETACCPVCGEPLTLRGHCPRGVIGADGKRILLIIRRLLCPRCGRLHHELPDCVVPYKRHCAETFDSIISGKPESAPCEERTLWRILAWWRVVGQYFLRVLKALCEKYGTTYPAAPAFKETVRAAANSNNWIFARSICTRSACMSV
jgi:hypothetical protein